MRKYATPAFVNRHMEQENKKLRQEQDKALNKHAESEKASRGLIEWARSFSLKELSETWRESEYSLRSGTIFALVCVSCFQYRTQQQCFFT